LKKSVFSSHLSDAAAAAECWVAETVSMWNARIIGDEPIKG